MVRTSVVVAAAMIGASISAVAATWTPVWQSDALTASVDQASFERSGDVTKAWLKLRFLKEVPWLDNAGAPVVEQVALWSFHCDERTFSIGSTVNYDAARREVDRYPGRPWYFREASPDTLGAAALQAVCAH